MTSDTIDRIQGPAIKAMEPVDFPHYGTYHLDNSIPVYTFTDFTVEALQLVIQLPGGRLAEQYPGVAAAVASNFVQGFKLPDGTEVREYLLHRGAEIEAHAYGETFSIRVLCLRRHWKDIIHLLKLLLTTHPYPAHELAIHLARQKSRYEVNMMKTDYRAQRCYNEVLFGKNHPLGYAFSPDMYDNITPENLTAYARKQFVPANMRMYLAGCADDTILNELNVLMGDITWTGAAHHYILPPFNTSAQLHHIVNMPQTLQSAIMAGCMLPAYTHPDAPAVTFITTLLGGYFGSRLMQNLREEHGYTYGIHASTSMNSTNSCLYISTDVGRDVTQPALEQIQDELREMCGTLCEEEEINSVRNVLMGKALRRIDGVFNAQSTLGFLHIHGANVSHFRSELDSFNTLSPEDIRAKAIQYFNPEALYTVIAGDVAS